MSTVDIDFNNVDIYVYNVDIDVNIVDIYSETNTTKIFRDKYNNNTDRFPCSETNIPTSIQRQNHQKIFRDEPILMFRD